MVLFQKCVGRFGPSTKMAPTAELSLKGNFAIFYMLAKYVPGDIKYIFTKFYWHISTDLINNKNWVTLLMHSIY